MGTLWIETIEKVRWDVLNEYVSIETGRRVYGVVMDPETFEVDYQATMELRKKLKSEEGRTTKC